MIVSISGLHRFNVSVTDGKFTVYAPIVIDVADIDQAALDHSLSVRFSGLNAATLVREHLTRFVSILARLLGVPNTHVRILAIQDLRSR